MAILVNTINDADDTHAIQQCVQCGHDYAEKDNVSGSCDYHPAISYTYHSWSCELSCCGMSLSSYTPFPSSGCTKGSHAKAHHDRFPYINRLGHYRTILQGSDTWLRVQQHDVTVAKSDGADIGATLAGHVGILRDNESVAVWATQDGVIIDLNVLPLPPSDPNNDTTVVLIATNVSTLINDTWNKDIAADGLGWSVQVTRASLPANGSCFRISVHTPTAPTPNVKELHVHGDSADASRSIITVFDNDTDLHDLYPSTDSSLSPSPPPSIQSFRRIPPQLFLACDPLPTFQSSGDLPLRVKAIKPVVANSDLRPYNHDLFTVQLLLVDTSAMPSPTSPSSQPLLTDERHIILTMVRDQQISVDQAERLLIATASHATSAAAALAAHSSPSSGVSAVALTLVEVKATLSLDHGHTWVTADQVELNGHSNDVLTYLIPKGGVDKVQVTARFPAPNKHGQWSHRAFVTKLLLHPAIVRYTFENALGQVTSLDVAFQNPPLAPLPSRDPLTDWFFIDMDHLDDFTRSYAKVTRPPPLNDSTDTDPTLFVLHSCHKNGPTSSYSVTARTVRLWRSQLNHRLQHPIQSAPTELEYLPLLAISEPNKVEWTAGFDSTRSTLVLLRVKLMYENDVAEDSWVLDWPAVPST